ncbi:MAG: hypothetical protein ABSE73_13370 [Planctomycetota bacterium]
MKPSFSGIIGGHMWRAAALRQLLADMLLIEIFPSAWFWLCDHDTTVEWKGDSRAKMRKVSWFKGRLKALGQLGLSVSYGDRYASADDADALPCVLCAVLANEGWELQRLDNTQPPVLFPPRCLWDITRLPASIRKLPWKSWTLPTEHEAGLFQI